MFSIRSWQIASFRVADYLETYIQKRLQRDNKKPIAIPKTGNNKITNKLAKF